MDSQHESCQTLFDLLPDDVTFECMMYMQPGIIQDICQHHPKFDALAESPYFKVRYLRNRAFARDKAKLHQIPFAVVQSILSEIDKKNNKYIDSEVSKFLDEDEYGLDGDLRFNRKCIDDYYGDITSYILDYLICRVDLCHGDIIGFQTSENMTVSYKEITNRIFLLDLNDDQFTFASYFITTAIHSVNCNIMVDNRYHSKLRKLPFDFYHSIDHRLAGYWNIDLSKYRDEIISNSKIDETYESFFVKDGNIVTIFLLCNDVNNYDYSNCSINLECTYVHWIFYILDR